MINMYSVIYDPIAKEPFGIIDNTTGTKTAHPIQKSASHWAIKYNSGDKTIPYGLEATEFVEMDSKFTNSFKSTFSSTGRVDRRAKLLSQKTEQYIASEIIYGASLGRAKRRKNGVSRKVLPIVGFLQKEFFRAELINEAIRTGRRWVKKNEG